MSLYIEEMTLPHEDVEPMHLELYADGTVFFMKAPDDCYEFKAVPVPPHGRLIDADARVNVQMYNDEFEDYQTVNMSIDDLLDSSWIELEDDPTIIPAEGRET